MIKLREKKTIKNEDIPDTILFELINMTKNNITAILTESAGYIEYENRDYLKNEKLIQTVSTGDVEKYALTLKGIAYCINIEYKTSFENQFLAFLRYADDKITLEPENLSLDWKEKLATLTLLLLASTSESSAIVLNEKMNQKTFEAALREILKILQNSGLLEVKHELPESRGEPPATLFMRSRINELPRKTNHIYTNIGRGGGYYLDIETKEGVDEGKIAFLLRRIFENYHPDIKYFELKNSLMKISEKYHPQFLARRINSKAIFGITNKLDSFFDSEIWELPVKYN